MIKAKLKQQDYHNDYKKFNWSFKICSNIGQEIIVLLCTEKTQYCCWMKTLKDWSAEWCSNAVVVPASDLEIVNWAFRSCRMRSWSMTSWEAGAGLRSQIRFVDGMASQVRRDGGERVVIAAIAVRHLKHETRQQNSDSTKTREEGWYERWHDKSFQWLKWKNISRSLFAEIKVRRCHREVLEDNNDKLTNHPIYRGCWQRDQNNGTKIKQNYRVQNCVHLLKILKATN